MLAGLQDLQQKSTPKSLGPLVVTPDQESYNPMQFLNDTHPWDSQAAPDLTMPIYDAGPSPQLDTAVNTPLPPSPNPMIGSPIVSMTNQHSQFQLDDANTLGLGFS